MSNTTTPPGIDPALIDKRSGKLKRISKPLQEAIRLIETGTVSTIKAASERVGLTYSYLSEALRKPHVTRVLSERKRLNLAAAALRGSQRALELLDSPSERTSIEATKLVLGIDGFRPESAPTVNLAVDVRAGWVIDLSSPREPVQNDVTEHQIGPAIDALPDRQTPFQRLEPLPASSSTPPTASPANPDYRLQQRAVDERQVEVEREFGLGRASRSLPHRGGER